ncbi:MAG: thioredoxin [Sedimentibacter sp.]
MTEKMIFVNSTKEFDDLLAKEKFVLVDFWATWCAPCRMIAPIIEKLAEQYAGKIKVAKVDVDQQQELAIRYGISSIPTVILYKDGKISAKEIGVKPLNSFTKMLDTHIA